MKTQKDNFYYKKRSNWLGRFWRGYLRPAWENYRWLIIGMLWLGTFVLGCIGAVKQMRVLESIGDERKREGWKYVTDPKDIERKTSPYMIPWDDKKLPDDIKEYDRNTVRGLPAFLSRVGLQVYHVK